jgi:hypothetical protein
VHRGQQDGERGLRGFGHSGPEGRRRAVRADRHHGFVSSANWGTWASGKSRA